MTTFIVIVKMTSESQFSVGFLGLSSCRLRAFVISWLHFVGC